MAIQPVEFWEQKAKAAQEMAEAMGISPSKEAMLDIAQRYRQLAEETRKFEAEEGKRT